MNKTSIIKIGVGANILKKHSFSEWMAVTRYWSFVVSSMPVIVTFAYLVYRGMVPGWGSVLNFLLALLGVVILHGAGNVLSDYYDFKCGVDNAQAYSVQNLVAGRFSPKEYLFFSLGLFALGALIGMVLVLRAGLLVLAIGAIGVALTALYSFLKYNALGDLDIFVIFSVLIISGTTVAVSGAICWDALVLALPIGIITVSVLHANNTVDIETDKAAGIKTFAMLLGPKASCILYQIYMLVPFICIIFSVAFGLLPWICLLSLLACIPAFRNYKAARGYRLTGLEAMKGLDQASSKLQLVFSLLLAVSLFVAAIFLRG